MSDVWPAPLRDPRPNQHDRTVPKLQWRGHSSDPKHLTSTTPAFVGDGETAQNRHMGRLRLLLCWTVVGGAIVGIPLRWTVVGAIVGIPLFIVGRRMATGTFICHCGNEMTKDTKICPTCGAHFP